MKKYIIITSVLASITLATACSSTKKTTASKRSGSEKETEIKVPNYTVAELEEGKGIWEAKCDRCHKLYSPESYTKTKWEGILPRMNKRSKLNEDEAGKVRGYIMSRAKA